MTIKKIIKNNKKIIIKNNDNFFRLVTIATPF